MKQTHCTQTPPPRALHIICPATMEVWAVRPARVGERGRCAGLSDRGSGRPANQVRCNCAQHSTRDTPSFYFVLCQKLGRLCRSSESSALRSTILLNPTYFAMKHTHTFTPHPPPPLPADLRNDLIHHPAPPHHRPTVPPARAYSLALVRQKADTAHALEDQIIGNSQQQQVQQHTMLSGQRMYRIKEQGKTLSPPWMRARRVREHRRQRPKALLHQVNGGHTLLLPSVYLVTRDSSSADQCMNFGGTRDQDKNSRTGGLCPPPPVRLMPEVSVHRFTNQCLELCALVNRLGTP